jgi:primosomal protein N' (replication factor Y)
MKYAEVSVNSPIAQRRTFSYAIPPNLDIEIGQAVWIPFGEKTLQGVVLEIGPFPAVEETREIIDVIEPQPFLSPAHVSLARWISEYYLSSLFDAVALMLPPGFERKALTFVSLTPEFYTVDLTVLFPQQRDVFELVRKLGNVSLKELEKRLGKKKAQVTISQLAEKELIKKTYEIEPVKVSPKKVPYLRLDVSTSQAQEMAAKLRGRRAIKQAELLEFLSERSEPVPWSEASQQTSSDKVIAQKLLRKGLVAFQQVEIRREPISYDNIVFSLPLKLATVQESVFKSIQETLHRTKACPEVFLLHGVTGSGKTEIYLQALAETVKQGRRGIVLVPEIALTPQTIERFASRFPHKVAVLHSKLSIGEQYDQWYQIQKGEFDVVIGPRSAIFAPQPDLGLIVIDEEHEWTYKQADNSPRYHARDVAIKLAELTEAVVILGSATPDLKTYYHTQKGDYHLLQLPERVVPNEGSSLPRVEVVDLRNELKVQNKSIFSRSLTQAITEALTNKEQVILFLNRRGGTTFIQCRHCGFVFRCRRCEIPLTQHFAEDALVCHQCNYKMPTPQFCPRCLSQARTRSKVNFSQRQTNALG